MKHAKILSVGAYLPQKAVTNFDLEKQIDTTNDWIVQRTGITQRYIHDSTTSDMAFKAAINCLNPISFAKCDGIFVKNYSFKNDNANQLYAANLKNASFVDKIDDINNTAYDIKDIDCLIVATTTPDLTFPSTACIVQGKLKEQGYNIGFAFDIQAVCAGFVYATCLASVMIKAGFVKSVMVIGADKLSSILNWNDRTTCVLFGDGAGAILMQASDLNTQSSISCESLHSDGSLIDILNTSAGTSLNGSCGHIQMDGKEVFKHAVSKMSHCISSIIEKSTFNKDEIDFVIAHQANERILDGVAKKLEMHKTHFVKTVDIHANTSSASIPLALNHCLNQGLILRGNKIIFEALGGGLTWGGALCVW